jgi:hypothetical protein
MAINDRDMTNRQTTHIDAALPIDCYRHKPSKFAHQVTPEIELDQLRHRTEMD